MWRYPTHQRRGREEAAPKCWRGQMTEHLVEQRWGSDGREARRGVGWRGERGREGEGGGRGEPPVVGQELEHRGDLGEHPARAGHERIGVLEYEHGGWVLSQPVEGSAQQVEGLPEVGLGDGAVQAGVLDTGETPEREVVRDGGEGPVIPDVRREVLGG